MASSSEKQQINSLDTEIYRDSEFIRKIGRIVYSEDFFESCERHRTLKVGLTYETASIRRSELISAIAEYEKIGKTAEEQANLLEKITTIWNILVWMLKTAKFGKQVYVHPVRTFSICEMSGYEHQQQNHFVYREDEIMVGIFYQAKAAILILGDKYPQKTDDFFSKELHYLLQAFYHLDVFSLSKEQLEMWYNPFIRHEFIERWKKFLEELIPRYVMSKYLILDTKNDYVEKLPNKIKPLDE